MKLKALRVRTKKNGRQFARTVWVRETGDRRYGLHTLLVMIDDCPPECQGITRFVTQLPPNLFDHPTLSPALNEKVK